MLEGHTGCPNSSSGEEPGNCSLIRNVFVELSNVKTSIQRNNLELENLNLTEKQCRSCQHKRRINLDRVINETIETQNRLIRMVEKHQRAINGKCVRSIAENTICNGIGRKENAAEMLITCELVSESVDTVVEARLKLKDIESKLECHIDKGEGCVSPQKPCIIEKLFSLSSQNYNCLRDLWNHVEEHQQLSHRQDSGFEEGEKPRARISSDAIFQYAGKGSGVQEIGDLIIGDEHTVPKSTEC